MNGLEVQDFNINFYPLCSFAAIEFKITVIGY